MTEVEFSRLLSELSSTSKELNAESDSINDLLSSVERQIAETNVGIDVQVHLDGGVGGDYLQWKKVFQNSTSDTPPGTPPGHRWGLAIDDSHVSGCSRDARIAALDTLPKLIETLTREARFRINSIERAKSLVKK